MMPTRSYDPKRDISSAFLDRVGDWIDRGGEVLIVLRYLCAAGAKDFTLCGSRAELKALVDWAAVGTDIEVFRDRQLPLRGKVSDQFIATILDAIPLGEEYLVVTLEKHSGRPVSRISLFGNDRKDLVDSIRELMGQEVACGVCPNFIVADHEGLISAAKGGIDGPR